MIDQLEMMRVIDNLRGDAVVVPTMRASVGWAESSTNMKRDISISGAMGKTSSFALGFCLAQPDTKVIVFDGDGSLVMNLGTMVTIANQAPKNLYHFVMDNGVYGTTGGQPVPGAGTTSYAGMAKESGYAHYHEFDDLEDFVTQAEQILNETGPVLVSIKTIPNIRTREQRAASRGGGMSKSTIEAISDLMDEFGS
jgi:sulfopyruvate decarboxylase subunit beta